MVDRLAETLFTIYMNTNRNSVSTVWLKNGEQVTFSHRDTLRGWKNGLERRGVQLSDLDPNRPGQPGLPESDRA